MKDFQSVTVSVFLWKSEEIFNVAERVYLICEMTSSLAFACRRVEETVGTKPKAKME
jgi:hypothetical protein